MISKSHKWGYSPYKWLNWLVNGGYQLLTKWDDPPSIGVWGWQFCITLPETNMLLMEEILHQLIGSLWLISLLTGLLYIPGGAGFLPSTVAPEKLCLEDDPFLLGLGNFSGASC